MTKVISDYLRSLCNQWYAKISKQVIFNSTLTRWWRRCIIWCWVDIPIQEIINYINEQIYVHEMLTPICSKLIFRGLLIKLATECTFKSNSRILKQVDDCTVGWPLTVTFSDIYMIKMGNDVIPSKPIFYPRFADDIYSRLKLGDNVFFDQLNNYHPNIKLTIEVNSSKLLDTKLTNINGTSKFNVYQKKTKLPSTWAS